MCILIIIINCPNNVSLHLKTHLLLIIIKRAAQKKTLKRNKQTRNDAEVKRKKNATQQQFNKLVFCAATNVN